MHTVSPYTEFTRVASFPPDFGVTEQLSEFIEEESTSSSSRSPSSQSHSSSSQSAETCCCDDEPIVFHVSGFPDAGQCAPADDYNGRFVLDKLNAGVIIRNTPNANNFCQPVQVAECVWEAPNVAGGFDQGFIWSFYALRRPGTVLINAVLHTALTPLGLWSKEIDDCDDLDVTLTSDDWCKECTWSP